MKKFIQFLSLLLAISVLSSISVVAYADKPYKDSNFGNTEQSYSNYDTPAEELLKAASNYNKITLPSQSDFFVDYFPMYVDAPKGHSVNVHKSSAISSNDIIDTAYHGGRVYVVAEHEGAMCVAFFTANYDLKAGWVDVDVLNSDYPCETYVPSQPSKEGTRGTENTGDARMSWSKVNFPNTKTKYSVLRAPAEDCVEFTLDYQVTARNGSKTEAVLGDRDIFIYDGDGWFQVGTFDLDVLEPCHIRVTLDSPIKLCAVATIPHCASTSFVFRQSVLDIICES